MRDHWLVILLLTPHQFGQCITLKQKQLSKKSLTREKLFFIILAEKSFSRAKVIVGIILRSLLEAFQLFVFSRLIAYNCWFTHVIGRSCNFCCLLRRFVYVANSCSSSFLERIYFGKFLLARGLIINACIVHYFFVQLLFIGAQLVLVFTLKVHQQIAICLVDQSRNLGQLVTLVCRLQLLDLPR